MGVDPRTGLVLGSELEADYYNEEQMDNYKRWKAHPIPHMIYAADYLPSPNGCQPILELGCSFGLFALEINKRGYKDYLGIDFADKAIDKARELVPTYKFVVADLRRNDTYKYFKDFSIFVALETLEHLYSDIKILHEIPIGSTVIFSVPSGSSAGHIRYFPLMVDVLTRYSSLLYFHEVTRISQNGIYVCKAERWQ